MVADGHRLFLEVGPGEMLTRMVRWIDRTPGVVRPGPSPRSAASVDIVPPG